MFLDQIFDFVIVGGGISGLSAASVVSTSNSKWVIIERDQSVRNDSLTLEDRRKIRSNIPSSKDESAHYWLQEFEEDGWFSSTANFSWGRIPMIGGRSQLWSGWSPLINRADLLSYVAGRITDEQALWEQYLAARSFLEVNERPTLFVDTPPYVLSPAVLGENLIIGKLKGALLDAGIETVMMPRPHYSKYNAYQVYKESIKNLDNHVLRGVVVAIREAQSHVKTIMIMGSDNSSFQVRARTVILAASTLETNRILVDCLGSNCPDSIGSNLFDHAYVKDAIKFRIALDDQKGCNTKVYGKIFYCPELPSYRAALQISATHADQFPGSAEWTGQITILGEVPEYSRGKVTYSGRRDILGRLIPEIDYKYRAKVKQSMRRIISWLSGILSASGIDIISTSDQISRPGESLHEMGGLGFNPPLTDGVVNLLRDIYVCDGSGFRTFGPEHPALAMSGLAKYVANAAATR